jgi:molybdopterin synthase catalytic subunit
MTLVAQLAAEPFDPASELAALTSAASTDGAVVSFVGLVRCSTGDGEPVRTLVLEHHPRLTLESLEKIGSEAMRRFDVSHVRVVHRCGTLAPGDPIVFAGAASAHRRTAFEAADYLMDRLKTEAIFWKREEMADGYRWIEPTDDDYADRKRWE